MTLLGDTPEDRRRSLGLLFVVVLVSPFIVAAEIAAALGMPCRRWPG